MELKKGDVVAVVAEVVAERDGKIIISIPGATVSEDLIIAPRKPIRVLERSASPGDSVMYKNEIPCVYRRNETQNVVSLVREGMPHDDPTSYLFANIKDIRRIDQEGTVKFVSAERHFPNAETGREAMNRLKSEEDAGIAQQDDAAESGSVITATPALLEVPGAREEAPGFRSPMTETAETLSVLPPFETENVQSVEDKPLNVEADIEDEADEADDSASDKITIEMPEGFPARRPVVEEAVDAPAAPTSTEGAGEPAPMEENSEEPGDTVQDSNAEEQELPAGDNDKTEGEIAPEGESEHEAIAADGNERGTIAAEEDESPAPTPGLTEEEIEEKNRRLSKLREETITNLNGSEGDNEDSQKPASIFDDIDDLDDN